MLSSSLVPMKEEVIEDDFFKAFLVTLGYLALLSLLIFIPGIGFIMAPTIGAYVAGYRGGRYSGEWKKVSIIAAIIWSSIFVILMIWIGSSIFPLGYDIKIGIAEITLICIPYVLFIIFCLLGARARFKERTLSL